MTLAPTPQRSAGHRSKRRSNGGWRVLPPILREYDGPGPEGLSIVGEIDGELGLVLWKMLRAVTLWVESEPAERSSLFDADTRIRLEAEVRDHVRRDEILAPEIEGLLSVVKNPTDAEPAFVSRAADRVAAWADGRGASSTQMEYLRLAALASPADARYAVEIGGVARDLARYSLAEAWLHRAVGLARGEGDWQSYVMAYLKHGVMMARRGTLPAARRSFVKALRRSRRQRLADGEARALHELMVLEWRSGQREDAFRYAAEAVAVHGPGHPRMLRLVHDIAYMWIEAGYYEHALPVITATLEWVPPEGRPTVLGSLARAAAGAGDDHAYRWVWAQFHGFASAPGLAEAWVDLARAAFDLGRKEEAAEAAENAEAIARARGEGQMRFLAESILSDLERAQREAEQPKTAGQTDRPDELARKILRTLAAERAPAAAQAAG